MYNRIIINFTTIPPRIFLLESTINSLLDQTIKPDKIFINIPYKYNRFKNDKFIKPDFLNKKKYDIVEIFYLKFDYGPATKFIGGLFNNKINDDDLIVITDDDVIKKCNWLSKLLQNHYDNRVTCFVERNLGKSIVWGYLGYIFKKKLINVKDLLYFFSNVKNECFYVDDHWLTGYCHYRKIKIYNIPISIYSDINDSPLLNNNLNSLVDLKGKNNRYNTSNNCRNIIKKKYNTDFPFWCCIGCCNRNSNNIIKKNINLFKIVCSVLILVSFLCLICLKLKKWERYLLTILLISNLGLLVVIFKENFKKSENNVIKFENNVIKSKNNIPKVIIQTYHDKSKIPNKVYENIKKYAPDYEHIIFDDQECITFFEKYYNKKIINIFNKLKGAHKADLFRYCYLYKFGGIYLDIKTELVIPLNKIFINNYTYSVLSINRNSIYQGIIATLPHNNIFLKLIDFIVNTVEKNKKYKYIIFTIDFFKKIEEDCLKKPKNGLNINLKNGEFNYYLFKEFCNRNENSCYDGLDKHNLCCYVYNKNKKIFKTRYSDFPW
jgi:hypothetical protein